MIDSNLVFGSRLVLISCDLAINPTIGQKTELWTAPIERRGGVLVGRKRISSIHYYIVVLDEPLNLDCWEIDVSLAETYIASGVQNARQRMLLLPIEAVLNGTIILDVHTLRNGERREHIWKNPNEMCLCQRCDKAQLNRFVLFTCAKYVSVIDLQQIHHDMTEKYSSSN